MKPVASKHIYKENIFLINKCQNELISTVSNLKCYVAYYFSWNINKKAVNAMFPVTEK